MPRSKSKPSLQLGSFSIAPKIILVSILLLGFSLRLARLTFQPLWWDEGYSLFFATRDLPTLLDRTALDIHPPLYYMLLQLWTLFAGTSDYAVRFFSLAIGVLTIPFIYAMARHLFPRPAGEGASKGIGLGTIAAFLFAIAPIGIYYSQEVRMYGLVTLLCLASTYSFVWLIEKPTHSLWLAYVLASVAALYTQYYAGFVLVFQLIYIILMYRSSRLTFQGLRPWLFGWSSIALLYLPWVIYSGNKLYTYVSFKVGHEAYPAQDPIAFVAQHLAAFSVGHVGDIAWLNWVSIFFIAIAAYGLFVKFGTHSSPQPSADPQFSPRLLVLLYLFIPILLGYLVNVRFPFHPIRYERLLLLASPAFLLLVAIGLAAVKPRALGFFATIVIIAISVVSLFEFYTIPRYPDDDYRPLVQQVQSLAQPGDNFLAIFPWQIGYLQSYYSGAPLNVVEAPNDIWTQNPTQMQSDLDKLLARYPRVWLPALQTLGRIVEDSLDAELRPKNYSVLDAWFGTTRLELFQQIEDPPKSARPLRFGDAEPRNWGVSTNSVAAGRDVINVWFDWGEVAQNKMSLRLADAKGNVWAQDDREIPLGALRQRIGMVIPAGTPPGVYDLRLALYRDSNPQSEATTIASISVVSNDQPNFAAIPYLTLLEIDNGVRLVGYDASDKPARPGFNSGITLYWQSTQRQNVDYRVSLQLHDIFGKTWLDVSDATAHGIYGSSLWRTNGLVRDPHVFTVPGDLPDGTYTLEVGLIDPATKAQIGRSAPLTQLQVKGRLHYFGAPIPSQRVDARMGEIAKLVGYDLVRSARNLQIALYWQAQGRAQLSYKVFVHVVDTSGKIIAQMDQVPGAGLYPTTTWVKGEYLVDAYEFALPAEVDEYQIRIGMYDPGSGDRLPVFGAAGSQIGDFVTIR